MNEAFVLSRLKEYISYLGLTPTAFAREIKIPQSSFDPMYKGTRKLSLDVIVKTLERYPLLSSEWLIRGIGEMETRGDFVTNTQITLLKTENDYLNRKTKRLEDEIDYLTKRMEMYKELENKIKVI